MLVSWVNAGFDFKIEHGRVTVIHLVYDGAAFLTTATEYCSYVRNKQLLSSLFLELCQVSNHVFICCLHGWGLIHFIK